MFHPKLIRDDYTVGDLPTVDESVLLDDPTLERKSWIDTLNEVKVQYTELIGVERGMCECGTTAIGYTSQQMEVDEEQELTVENPEDGCLYAWAIASGGGSLSAAVGTSVTYTAPSTNPECANNPVITLTVRSVQCDSLEIAVNANAWAGQALETVIQLVYPGADEGDLNKFIIYKNPSPNTGLCPGNLYIGNVYSRVLVSYYKCDGSEWTSDTYPCDAGKSCGSPLMKDEDGKFYLCDNSIDRATAVHIAMYDDYSAQCNLGLNPWGDKVDASPQDLRTEQQKTDGCCPALLL